MRLGYGKRDAGAGGADAVWKEVRRKVIAPPPRLPCTAHRQHMEQMFGHVDDIEAHTLKEIINKNAHDNYAGPFPKHRSLQRRGWRSSSRHLD